jgi:hypothetical protein
MSSQIPFIGREDEIERIQLRLQSKASNLIYIIGDGGVGKTRLAQEVKSRLENQSGYFAMQIFDFDNHSLTVFENFELRLAEDLIHNGFNLTAYSNALRDLRKMESANVSPDGLAYQREQAQNVLINVFNEEISVHKRIVFFIDTVEKSDAEYFWLDFANFLSKVKNYTCILTGRKHVAFDLEKLLEGSFKGQIHSFELPPLKTEDALVYIEKKQEATHTTISPSVVQKLLFLTKGRPILIDLAVEYVARGISLDWLLKEELDVLEKAPDLEQKKYRDEFEKQLVLYITKIRKPIHRLFLTMSRVHPLDANMIAILLDIPNSEAVELFADAKSYAFVKELSDLSRITLHDEMRDLINRYVWSELDTSFTRRKRDSRLAVKIYKHDQQQILGLLNNKNHIATLGVMEVKELESSLAMIEEQLSFHLLDSGLIDNFSQWKNVVEENRKLKNFKLAKGLVDASREHLPSFSQDQLFEYLILDARLTNEIGQVEEAEQKLLLLLENFGSRDERKSGILNALGLVEEKLGRIPTALERQLECLEIVKRNNPSAIAPVSNRIGYLYRQVGDLKNAEDYYRLALKTISSTPLAERNQSLTASLFNNLGYIYGLSRKYAQMDLHCDQAAEIWSEIRMKQEIGRSETTRAIFHRDQGNYLSSLELLKQAIARYEEPDDHEQLCRSYFHLGWTQWYVAEKVNELASDISLIEWDAVALSLALDYFLKSLDLAKKYGLKYELPGVMHQTSSVYWYLGKTRKDKALMEKARELNQESYAASIQVYDYRYAIDSLLGDAEWDYDIGLYNKISDYDLKLQSEYGQFRNQYKLYFGRMHRIKADIAFRQHEWETAFSNYAVGLGMIQHHHGFGRYAVQRELLRLSRKLRQLAPNQTKEWLQYLRTEWLKLEGKQDVDLLLGWCDQLELRGLSE